MVWGIPKLEIVLKETIPCSLPTAVGADLTSQNATILL